MLDILSKTDKEVLIEIITQGMIKNITLEQSINIVKNFAIDEAKKQAETLILQGKASQILKQFQVAQPQAYEELKQMISEYQKEQEQKGVVE